MRIKLVIIENSNCNKSSDKIRRERNRVEAIFADGVNILDEYVNVA
jgi:hypothetical protein